MPEHAPENFDPRLARIDDRLRRYAAAQTPPTGLAERVYRASVDLLAPPRAIPFEDGRRPWAQPAVWSRLALAASIGLAFFVASPLMTTDSTPSAERIVTSFSETEPSPGEALLVALESDNETMLPLLVDPMTSGKDTGVATVLTGGTSFDDLESEMSQITRTLNSSM